MYLVLNPQFSKIGDLKSRRSEILPFFVINHQIKMKIHRILVYYPSSFTKWRGRNFIGFKASQHSPYTNAKKYPSRRLWSSWKIGYSVLVHLCVCVFLAKMCHKLWLNWPICSKLSGSTKLLASNFRVMIRIPRPLGSGLDPKRWVSHQIYLLPGLCGSGLCHTFSVVGQGKKILEQIFIFGPQPRKWGW